MINVRQEMIDRDGGILCQPTTLVVDTEHASTIDECPDVPVTDISHVGTQRVAAGMRVDRRLCRCLDRFKCRQLPDMRYIDDDPLVVERLDGLEAEPAKPCVGPLPEISVDSLLSLLFMDKTYFCTLSNNYYPLLFNDILSNFKNNTNFNI
jgi:hypothetical protein